jgi:hypothetical protein
VSSPARCAQAPLPLLDDQPTRIIDVFISKLRKKLRNASGVGPIHRDDPQRAWILRDVDATSGA